jgi:hypothetical protein
MCIDKFVLISENLWCMYFFMFLTATATTTSSSSTAATTIITSVTDDDRHDNDIPTGVLPKELHNSIRILKIYP